MRNIFQLQILTKLLEKRILGHDWVGLARFWTFYC